MPDTYLENPEIRLRPCEPEDLDMMYDIENDASLWDISGTTSPYSRYALRQYIASSQNDIFADKQLRLVVLHKASGKAVGMADLTDYEPLHQRAAVGIVIRKDCRRHGCGTQALQLLCSYAFRFLHLHQLYAWIPQGNEASLALFARCGFAERTLLKDWLQTEDASYKNAWLVQRIAPAMPDGKENFSS